MNGLFTARSSSEAVAVAREGYSGNIEPEVFFAAIERKEEMARLQAQAEKQKSLLIFGPEAVGKTRLIRAFVKTQTFALFVPRVESPREVLLSLVAELHRIDKPGAQLPANAAEMSTRSMKGLVQRALEQYPFLLVLDHLAGPSRIVTGLIKDLNYFDRTPVFFVARTPHMEDIGALQPMCARNSERLALNEFAPPIALEFARWEARRTNLWASNLYEVLKSLVDWSKGNPGSIVHMLKMAHLPRYWVGDQIKSHVLYLDYRMGRRE